MLFTRHAPQEGVARKARRLFETAIPMSLGARPFSSCAEAHLELLAQLYAELRVGP